MGPDAIAATQFAPPSGYAYEPEFTGPPPRPLPDSLNDGPFARETRATIVRLFAFGLICFVLPYVPGVKTLSYYLLPLGYLGWIGLASLVIAAGGATYYSLRRGPFRYVSDGLPLVARVADLRIKPSKLGHNLSCYQAVIVYRHPETGEITQSVVKSKDIAAQLQHKYEPHFRVGDYVTAVYLPGKRLESTLRLYAFLDLSPEVNIRRTQAAESSLRTALKIASIVSLALVLFANVYALERYEPLELGFRQVALPAAAGGVLLGALLFFSMRSPSQGRPRRVLSTVFVGFGVVLIGAITGVCWTLMANAWLDRSPVQAQPARIVELWTKTYDFIFRSYEIEYQIAESPGSYRMLTTLEHLRQFRSRRAVANVRRGAFGWSWVEAVEPAATE